MGDALAAWTAELRAWEIPPHILNAAPSNPYVFPRSISVATIDPLVTPTGAAILERLDPGERLLDVGCGAGRISGPFTADHSVVGVEPKDELADKAEERGIEVHRGRWPDLADRVGTAPVVLCTHVLYDVQEPEGFLRALDAAAERRVVIELTQRHPWVDLGPFYLAFHDLPRPHGPSVELLVEIVGDLLDVAPTVQAWSRPRVPYERIDDLVADTLPRLCLGPGGGNAERLADMLEPHVIRSAEGVRLQDQQLATLFWDRRP